MIGRPRSLRGRLLWGTVALAVIAVLVTEAIGVQVLRSWLLRQVDDQLDGFPVPRSVAVVEFGPPPGMSLPSDFRIVVYAADGERRGVVGSGPTPTPDLPDTVAELTLPEGRPATVGAVSGDDRWRVRRDTAADGAVFVVCLPLDTVDGATARLIALDTGVLAALLIALIVIGHWVVRLGLRPLWRMERTAREITAGDLDARARDTDPATEIGRLGAVLNTMLDQLQSALDDREASEQRLRRFVADAGHELRTPLTTIQGFAQLTLRAQPDAEARREADQLVAENAARMSRLVDDLLLLAEVDREPDQHRHPVDLLALAADVIPAVAPRVPKYPERPERTERTEGWEGPEKQEKRGRRQEGLERPVRLERLSGTGALERVHAVGDADRLRQVLTNLLTNALIHTPPGNPVHVRVGRAVVASDPVDRFSATPALPPGTPVAVVEVADHGLGLEAGDAIRVFERFYRTDPSRSGDAGGTGLGLAIATSIAQAHGGRLELDTRPGAGCTFRLVLPLAAE
ncbi:HAMP domain-containing sensor histidine kinase [Actinoplanes sp. NPDC051851]|uniref:sensor histidine kinase n=1 Tax=Actinoplanes sp. NPDC051851 TaxID=3154753 RepID=UPI00343BA29D